MKKDIKAFSILLLSIIILIAYNMMKEKKYKFDARLSVPSGYFGEAVRGGFVGEALMDYGSTLRGSWGSSSSIVIIGDGMNPLPDSVRVRAYSYVDDKFYSATRALPQERVKELLETRFKDTNDNYMQFTTFNVSIAPGGWVCVWLGGGAGRREICSFQAEEATDWDYKKALLINTEREEWLKIVRGTMYNFVQKEIAENRVPYDYWKRLSKKYKWKLVTNDPEFEVYDYSTDLINVERYYSETGLEWLTSSNEKAIVKRVALFLKHDKDPLRYKISLELVESYDQNNKDKEGQIYKQMTRTRYLMDLFDKFYAQAGDQEVSLMIEFSHDMKSAQVKLVTATKEQIIDGCKLLGIWNSDEANID